ncbi:MAG: DNA polymerase III subunit delta [Armatimonadota bacterium]|nr:DNA polymerase III subunit delta [Armatimonadota bacterium]
MAKVYLFEGKEDVQKLEGLTKLTSQLIDEGFADFDLETLEGQGVTASRLLTAANVPPFASKKRVVVVRRANAIPIAEQDSIASKLHEIPDSAVVVLMLPAPEMKDGQAKASSKVSADLSKAVNKVGVVVTFASLRAEEAGGIIAKKIAASGKRIDAVTLRKLVDRVGSDLSILKTEAQKLIDYAGDNASITVKDVEFVTEQKPEELIWKLLDSVGSRNTSAALRLLKDLLQMGGSVDSEAPRLLAMILRQLRLIWQVKVLADMGQSLIHPSDEAMEALPANNNVAAFCARASFQVQKLQSQARNFTLAELERCFEYAARADLTMKGVEGEIEDPAVILEMLVINLCRRRPAQNK